MRTILLGTNNRHKIKEISSLLSELNLEIKTLADFPAVPSVNEDGETLEENALKKAKHYAQATGLFTFSEDTGLEVPALNGQPGVLSARYAGEQCSYEDNNRKLLSELSKMKTGNRNAYFRTVIALYDPVSDSVKTVEGKRAGKILEKPRGKNGFGYDPVFYLPELKKTLAELTLEEKNKISHRALALLKAKEFLKKL